MTLRERLHIILEREDEYSPLSWWINAILITLIAANVLAVSLETVDWFYARHAALLDAFDVFSVMVFSIEYLVRLWIIVEDKHYRGWRGRLRYALTPMALIDLLAILPFYLSLLFGADLRFLRALRLLRVFKLTRYSKAMSMLFDVLREEAGALAACFFILFVLLIVTASGAYLVEKDVQPDVFGSVPEAMWWALVTLTTVGYGDVTPVTLWGRIFGGAVTVIGVGMAALPAGILASGFSQALHGRRDEMREQFRAALADGVIDAEEANDLEELRKSFGLSPRVAQEILRSELEAAQQRATDKHDKICVCPNCGTRF